MTEAAAAVLARLLGRAPSAAQSAALASAYLREWNAGVSYPPGTGSPRSPTCPPASATTPGRDQDLPGQPGGTAWAAGISLPKVWPCGSMW
jgi:hypothetical protein